MRHRVTGRRLNRTTSHRKALRRNLAASLFQHGAIRTTQIKAKELRPFVERMIALAKKGTLHARRRVIAELGDRAITNEEGESLGQTVIQKLFDEIAPRYADRPGGYTRIIRLDERRLGDAGSQVVLQLVEESSTESPDGARAASRRKRQAAKRHEATAAVSEEPLAEEGEQAEDAPDAVDEEGAGDATPETQPPEQEQNKEQ